MVDAVPAGSWPFTPAPFYQPEAANTSTQGFLPYPPKDFRPVLDGVSEWSAPYPSLSGQYLHVYPRPSFYNSAVCSSRDPQLPPPEQPRDRSQRVPPPAGFYGHLSNASPLVTPAEVPPHVSHSLSPPHANVSSHPVTQVQLSSAGTQVDEGGATSLQLRGEESVQATTQQGARQSGSEDEDVPGAVRQEALGTSDDTIGIKWLAEASLAPATRRCYQGAWERWLGYQASFNSSISGQIPSITGFMWNQYNEGVSKARMGSLLAGISFMARLNGTQDPTKSFIISKALKGWSRMQPMKNDTRRPIDGQILARLVEVLQKLAIDDYEALLFGLAFSVAYHGAFRISELVARSKNDVGGALLSRNVILQPNVMRCKIVKSKTDQLGRGHWLTITEQQGAVICPVIMANKFASLRPTGEGVWLTHMDKTPLTKFQFNALLKRALGEIGLNPADYGTHSFRIGAATAAAVGGASVPEIQALGRWRSQAYKKYIRPYKEP
ncbi:uncharacterized protein LOC142134383 [Mixophyes fleayi]|uniref:uncharacterized protein LOC142134383 n=1 Tax=Mixophyes fleayi TaxID=3061075 RepID=UPI003F4DBAD9